MILMFCPRRVPAQYYSVLDKPVDNISGFAPNLVCTTLTRIHIQSNLGPLVARGYTQECGASTLSRSQFIAPLALVDGCTTHLSREKSRLTATTWQLKRVDGGQTTNEVGDGERWTDVYKDTLVDGKLTRSVRRHPCRIFKEKNRS